MAVGTGGANLRGNPNDHMFDRIWGGAIKVAKLTLLSSVRWIGWAKLAYLYTICRPRWVVQGELGERAGTDVYKMSPTYQ